MSNCACGLAKHPVLGDWERRNCEHPPATVVSGWAVEYHGPVPSLRLIGKVCHLCGAELYRADRTP